MERILIIGAAGQLGSELTLALTQQYGGDNVIATDINPKALEILDLTRQEVASTDQHLLFHHHRPDGSPYPNSECPIYLTLHDGHKRQGEEWFFRKNGEGFPVRYSVTSLRDKRNEGAVVVFHDISESRKADELTLAEGDLAIATDVATEDGAETAEEIDEFINDNAGLVVAEVELASVDQVFVRPATLRSL